MRSAFASLVLLFMLALTRVSLLAAQTDITLELGASQVGPQIGDDGESARFGVGGIRASHYSLTGSGISGSFLFGHTIGGNTGGDFFSASLASSMVEDWGGGWTGGMDLRLLGLGIRAPFPYRALAAEGGPLLRYRSRSVSLTTAAVAGVGRSRIEVWRVAGGRTRVFLDDLWRIGGTTELLFGTQTVQAGIAGGIHETTGGTFSSGGGRIVFVRGSAVMEVRADVWRTPGGGTDLTGGLEFIVPLSGWSLRGFLGRSEPDPLTLAGPGSGSGGLLIGRSVFARLPSPPPPVGYQIVADTPRGVWVRMLVDAPAAASRVEIVGDFTVWEPVPMVRRGDRWEAELEVHEGAHHYGYLVDGEWYVPKNERSLVPDEWGRMTAILVIDTAVR
jgi:hypothetical protein